MQLARLSAMYAAPIPLRLVLALTFIWAGLGKIVAPIEVQGERAALLANMGYAFPAASQSGLQPTSVTPDPAPDPAADPADESGPIEPADPVEPAQTETERAAPAAAPVPAQPLVAHTAAEFPDPVQVRRLYGVALLTYAAAHPAQPESGSAPPPPIWPEWAARGRWPIVIAWFASITEVVAGVFVLVGLLTRLSALAIAGVMLTAMWLTELGPAIQSAQTVLGFLPRHGPWDIAAWSTLLWQTALLGAALALCFAGPGAVSLDRVHSREDDEFDDEDDEA